MLEEIFAKLEDFLVGTPIERTETEQRVVDEETKNLSLYHFPMCPYCLRVRRVIKKLKLDIKLRDINRVAGYRTELLTRGGHTTVPCLRIQGSEENVQWLYESSDINRYLANKFGQKQKET
jgi:glutathione S-transferase